MTAQRLVIIGASGMIGGYALHYALDHPVARRVTVIGRKTVGLSHPKLKEVLHPDFADCSALADTLAEQDGAVFCLGPCNPHFRARKNRLRHRAFTQGLWTTWPLSIR